MVVISDKPIPAEIMSVNQIPESKPISENCLPEVVGFPLYADTTITANVERVPGYLERTMAQISDVI